MAQTAEPRPPLGVFALISESFGLLRSNFTPIAIIALAVTVLSIAFQYVILPPTGDFESFNIVASILGAVISVLIIAIQSAVLTGIAYDSKQGNAIDLAAYVRVGVAIILYLIVIGIVLGILIGFGILLFVLPGLYLAAVFSVTIPALVIERLGFGAMGRSVSLTSGYRWPILGFLALMYLVIFAVAAVLGVLTMGADPFAQPPMALAFATELVVNFISSALALGTALVYARLREIKEGVGLTDLAKVFE